jgi:hypothetical protein
MLMLFCGRCATTELRDYAQCKVETGCVKIVFIADDAVKKLRENSSGTSSADIYGSYQANVPSL